MKVAPANPLAILSAVITKANIFMSATIIASHANNKLLRDEISAPINKDLIIPR